MKSAESPQASIIVAVSDSSDLGEHLSAILKGIRVETNRSTLTDDVREIVSGGGGRVLLIDRSELPADPTAYIEEVLCDEGAPTLVVVTDGDDALERAQMLAAGAAHVVDLRGPRERVGRLLSTIAHTAAEGGLDGPEIRGNDAQPRLGDFISRSNSMRRFVETVERVADVDCSLLITGETGVGKERLARAIHGAGARDGPFVGVNCGALTEALLESQLFGHEPGSFTGARARHRGHFEQASGGTVFLDEITEIPFHAQVKLLTVLQRHEVQPLGAEQAVPVDVRVIAATNRDLKEQVRQGRFREDLYYRLNVIQLQVPPLRQRVADIPDLVGSLIQFFRCDLSRTNVESISEEALEALMGYAWPGNIRELVNVIERAMILSDGPYLGLQDLPGELASHVDGDAGGAESGELLDTWEVPRNWRSQTLREVRDAAATRAERAYLELALRAHKGRVGEVARQAHIGARSLYDKMQRLQLRKEDFRTGARAPVDGDA